MEPIKEEEVVEETITHEVTEEEIKENGLDDVLTPGDKIEIPVEDVLETVEEKVVNENYRECVCGTLVPLPDGSAEEFTICEGCGIKHAR